MGYALVTVQLAALVRVQGHVAMLPLEFYALALGVHPQGCGVAIESLMVSFGFDLGGAHKILSPRKPPLVALIQTP